MTNENNMRIDFTLERLEDLVNHPKSEIIEYDQRTFGLFPFVLKALKQGIIDSRGNQNLTYDKIAQQLEARRTEYSREDHGNAWEMFSPAESARFAYMAYIFGNAYYLRKTGNNLAAELFITIGILGLSDVAKNAPVAGVQIAHRVAILGLQDDGNDKLQYCLALEKYLEKEGILDPSFTTKS